MWDDPISSLHMPSLTHSLMPKGMEILGS